MTEPRGPIGWANQQQTEREQQPTRHTVDTITSDALDQLYARIATLEHVASGNKRHVQLIVPDLEAALARAEKAEAKAAAMTAAMESTAAAALRHSGCHGQLMAQCMRAEQAEAANARIRTFCDELDATMRQLTNEPTAVHPVAENIRYRLAEPKEPRT